VSDSSLPRWLVAALWVTTPLNLLGAYVFSPLSGLGVELGGFPADVHPLYRWALAEFIGLFGLGYGWCAYTRRAPRFFIAMGAAGKLSFFATLASYWLARELPARAVVFGSADLWLGLAFALWVFQTRE
jgi:hypothetical protein